MIFSARKALKPQDFAGEKFFKKSRKKVLTNGIARGIINKRSRERVENDRQTMTAQKHFVN